MSRRKRKFHAHTRWRRPLGDCGLQKCFEPVVLGVAEIFHVIEGLAATEQGVNRDEKNVDQVVILGAIDTRINDVYEV